VQVGYLAFASNKMFILTSSGAHPARGSFPGGEAN